MADHIEPAEFKAFDIDLEGMEPEQGIAVLVEHALRSVASDLLLACNERDYAVSMREKGILRRITTVSRDQGIRFITYLKAMSGMDVAQRQRPLDGRWLVVAEGDRKVDLRINTIPTLHGEDMAIRLLERESRLVHLSDLGMLDESLNLLRSMLASPSGLFLVSGPAGTGKTTSLYACLRTVNDGTRKINTIEDPVEYALPGVRQSQVNPRINLDFPELLRSVLRQSPDVIMVGEIRDPVTAQTSVRAAKSGHLVFATVHAPFAAGTIDAMLALGVPPYFLGTSLLGAMTQRLVRTLCPHCKVGFDITDSPYTFDDVRPWLREGEGARIYSAPGCDHCYWQGFVGRTGVFEVFRATKEIRQMITDGRTSEQIRDRLVEIGVMDLRRAALLAVARGVTSLEEVLRVIPTEQLLPGN